MFWDFVVGIVVGAIGAKVFNPKKKARDGGSQTDPPVPKSEPVPIPRGLRNFWY